MLIANEGALMPLRKMILSLWRNGKAVLFRLRNVDHYQIEIPQPHLVYADILITQKIGYFLDIDCNTGPLSYSR